MYFVAAIRVGNVLFVGHKLGKPFLCLPADITSIPTNPEAVG